MVRFSIVSIILLWSNGLFAQYLDSLECKLKFDYYDETMGNTLVTIWDSPPSLKPNSNKHLTVLRRHISNINLGPIYINIIINEDGEPICFGYTQEIGLELKPILESELFKLRFNPALQRNISVQSIYTLKIEDNLK